MERAGATAVATAAGATAVAAAAAARPRVVVEAPVRAWVVWGRGAEPGGGGAVREEAFGAAGERYPGAERRRNGSVAAA